MIGEHWLKSAMNLRALFPNCLSNFRNICSSIFFVYKTLEFFIRVKIYVNLFDLKEQLILVVSKVSCNR